jgi:cobalt/nickel transport protein
MTRVKTGVFIAGGLLVALLLAGVVSSFASGDPDGLDSATLDGCTVSADGEITGGDCIAQQARDHEIGGPFADYAAAGVDDPFWSTAISGVLGVVVVFAIGAALFWLIRRRPAAAESRP